MFNDNRNFAALAVAWTGTVCNFITSHLSLVLSTMCAIAALGASLYSIKVSRSKLRIIRAHDEALCKRCRDGNLVECPYPDSEHPEDCPRKGKP